MWPCCCRCHVCRSVTTQKHLKKIKGRGIFQTHLVQYLWLSRDKHSVVHTGFNRCLWHHHERSGRTQRHPDSDNRYRCNPAANTGDSVASLSSPVMYGRTQDGGRTTCEMGDAAHSRLKKKSWGIPFNTPRLQRTMLWWMTEVETARMQLPATDSWRTDVQKERCEDKGDIRRVRFPSCHHSIAYSNLWASVNISMTLQHEKDIGHLLHDLSAFRFGLKAVVLCGAGPHNGATALWEDSF